jgi:hypothetical protein
MPNGKRQISDLTGGRDECPLQRDRAEVRGLEAPDTVAEQNGHLTDNDLVEQTVTKASRTQATCHRGAQPVSRCRRSGRTNRRLFLKAGFTIGDSSLPRGKDARDALAPFAVAERGPAGAWRPGRHAARDIVVLCRTEPRAELADRGVIGIYPVSGWWKEQPIQDVEIEW